VYALLAAKVAGVPFHDTVPVYCAVDVIVVTGIAPNTGAVTPGIARIDITISAFGVGTVSTVEVVAVAGVEVVGFWQPRNNSPVMMATNNPIFFVLIELSLDVNLKLYTILSCITVFSHVIGIYRL
jgi:hypothetical protein